MSTTRVAAVIVSPVGTPPAPVVRVLPLPRSEPLSDDELLAVGLDAPSMTAPTLPFDLGPGGAPPRQHAGVRRPSRPAGASPQGARPSALAATPAIGSASQSPHPATTGTVAVSRPVQSPARIATRRFLAVSLEIIDGYRPATHLRPLCRPEQFADITQRLLGPTVLSGRMLGRNAAVSGHPVGTRQTRLAPPRAGRGNQTGPSNRISVRRVQICEAVTDVAEVAVVLAKRDQVWAMALRLERFRDSWLCAHLELI